MAKLIQQGRIRDWLKYHSSFHVKLYSLPFAIIGSLVGFNILAAEPLNLFYYLSTLGLAYAIARETFGRNVARLATIVITFWPSLVLHTTQLLRDALFIPSILLLVLALVMCAVRRLSLKQSTVVTIAGVMGTLLAWLCRGDMWEMVSTILRIGAVIFLLVQLKERRFLPGNTIAIAAIIVFSFCIPRIVPTYRQSDNLLLVQQQAKPAGFDATSQPVSPLSKLARRVGLLRHGFITRYPLAGSNIDTDVEIHESSDLIRYLPRAVSIGFFAPFPNMWLTTGAQVGRVGRMVAGVEMLLLYLVLGLAGLTLVTQWRRPSVWLLFITAAVGCVALGCVVVNISTLYRMRYVFFILMIILGMKGLLLLVDGKMGNTGRSLIRNKQEPLSL